MNKNDLINSVVEKTETSKNDVAKAIDAITESITESLAKGEEVKLVGFGTFLVTHRAATTGRNPQTGAPINIAASNQPKFRAGSALKTAVNNK